MMEGVRWRVLMWAAVVIAAVAAAGLGAMVAVAGVDKAAGLAGVIVGFCEVAALLVAVVGWAGDRRAAATDRPGAAAAPAGTAVLPPPAGTAKYVVDASNAQGVQTGDGNTQHNDFR